MVSVWEAAAICTLVLLSGCGTLELDFALAEFGDENTTVQLADHGTNTSTNTQESNADIKDAVKDLVNVPQSPPIVIPPGGSPPVTQPPAPDPNPSPNPDPNPDPDPDPVPNPDTTTDFKESTDDDGQPSGRGAVIVISNEYLKDIAEVSIGGKAFANATDYEKLPNGGREHWRNGASAQTFHGAPVTITLKDGAGSLVGTINGSGGDLYRHDNIELTLTAPVEPGPDPEPTGEVAVVYDPPELTIPAQMAARTVAYRDSLSGEAVVLGAGTVLQVPSGFSLVQMHEPADRVRYEEALVPGISDIDVVYVRRGAEWPAGIDRDAYHLYGPSAGLSFAKWIRRGS